MIVLFTIINKAIIYMCLLNEMSYLRIRGLKDDHMHQGKNYPKPLFNSNIGLGKIGEIPGTTMQKSTSG